MSGICGWIGSKGDAESARAILADMSGHLHGDESIDTCASQTYAIAARTGVVPASTLSDDSLAVATLGRFVWRVPELTAIAAEQGDSHALMTAYRNHGPECVKLIGGSFAIAVFDTHNSTGLLAIDRMGIRTMCYAVVDGTLIFGSTADSVAAHPRVGTRVRAQAIFNYLFQHNVPSPGTIYENVHKLEPAECLVIANNQVERRSYWQLDYREALQYSQHQAEIRFRQLLRDSLARTLDGDDRVGAFLSGGTDSSTVAGLLGEASGRGAKTYSIGFSVDGFDEMEYARITARHFATEAHEYYLTPSDVVDAIPVVARAYDEPFANASAVPTYYCARMAHADGVRLMLAGDGGDEIFGGNARYAKQKVFELYASIPRILRHRVIEPLARAGSDDGNTTFLRKVRSYVHQASIPLPDRLESYNLLQRAPLAETLDPDFAAQVDVSEPFRLLRDVYDRCRSTETVNRMMNLDLKFTLADNDLRKVSRMCEEAGVEVRFPFLDDALVDFSGEIPARLKVRRLRLRHFFKQALREFLPSETLAKTKHGFGMPFGAWLQEYPPLADLARESLSAFERRRILRPEYLANLLRQHQTTHAAYFGTMIWVVMTLERWLRERKL